MPEVLGGVGDTPCNDALCAVHSCVLQAHVRDLRAAAGEAMARERPLTLPCKQRLPYVAKRMKAMASTADTILRALPLSALVFSKTPGQIERRAHFDKSALEELKGSIQAYGVIEPIIVRPAPKSGRKASAESFEVVAGERRVIAARQAKLSDIPALVRPLTDEQAVRVQLEENLRRERLNEISEARSYEELLKSDRSVAQLAAELAVSTAKIYSRLRLLELIPQAVKAYYTGGLPTLGHALLIASVPKAHELQAQALEQVLAGNGTGECMSYREAARHIERHYTLALASAPFAIDEAGWSTGVGACTVCPKNTACMAGTKDLFGDTNDAHQGLCTDPACHREKTLEHQRRLLARAAASGQEVIVGEEAQRIAPEGARYLKGYVNLNDVCPEASASEAGDRPTYRELLSPEFTPVLLQVTDSGGEMRVLEVASEEDLGTALAAAGTVVKFAGTDGPAEAQRGEDRRKAEITYRRELFTRSRGEPRDALDDRQLRAIGQCLLSRMDRESLALLASAWNWRGEDGKAVNLTILRTYAAAARLLAPLDTGELNRLLLDCLLVSEIFPPAYTENWPEPVLLIDEAARAGVDASQVRKELNKMSKKKRGAVS